MLKAKTKGNGSNRILIIVQNLPVPFDRRVWLECRTLTRAGYQVAVVCPKGPEDPSYQVIDGVRIYKYRPYCPGGGAATFFLEYAYSFAATLMLSLKAARGGRFGAVQSCNPPDIFWPIGVLFKAWHRSRFVFDHHDLCPETFESRFPDGPPLLYRGLRFLERCTTRLADHVISTNESYRTLVMDRDGVEPDRMTVVRTGPDPDKLRAADAVPARRRGRAHLAAYIGVMGPQDGVDIVINMADFVVNTLMRTDISFTLIGSGDCFDELVALRDQLKLGDFVEFTGRVPDEAVRDILSTADIGLSPDPKNPLNDVSTMNKTMEYMAFGLPVLAFDLRETRASAAEAGAYATPNDVEELARLFVDLVDDEPRRRSMGSAGRRRIEEKLAWSHQEPHYLSVYNRLLGREPDPGAWVPAMRLEVPPPKSQERAGSKARVAWYVRRLQRMSLQEVLWRSSDILRQRAWRLRRDGYRAEPKLVQAPRFESTLPAGALDAVPADDVRRLIRTADEILVGRWDVLGVTRQDMVAPDWFLDPLSGRRAPQAEYCFSINHRDQSVTGNVKQVWELSRHHHLTVLAGAYAFTGDRRYAERAGSHLQSWWQENPFLSGIHWTSGIELGIRLISWVWTRRLLDGWDDVQGLFDQNELARKQIWWHQTHLSGFRSRGSSANNHVVAEAAGQLVAALAFPWFEESTAWADESANLLQQELANNTFPSGVNRELAFDYHGLVAELGLIAGAEADRAGRPLPDATWRSLGRMLDVAAACLDCGLQAPRHGDSDEGRALVIAAPKSNRWEALLALGQALFGAPEWWPAAQPGVASTLLPKLARHRPLPDRPDRRPWHFGDAGITIFRSEPADGPEIWCRCDSGPHGFLSIAAHAHADALSIEVRHDGTEILTDPGTYCYSSDPPFRRYFRSTIGHNTLEVLGRDQSTSAGPTMWIRHAESRLIRLQSSPDGSEGRWVAEHFGYRTLDPPVTHRRRVEFNGHKRLIEITDEIDSAGRPAVRLAFHLGPTVEASLDGCILILRWQDRNGGEVTATMTLPSSLEWSLIRGSRDPVLGWYSPAFGQKVPATDVIGVGSTTTGSPLRTRLAF